MAMFMEVVTVGDLRFRYFKPFRQVVVFRGLIYTEKNFFIPLFMIVLGGGRVRFL